MFFKISLVIALLLSICQVWYRSTWASITTPIVDGQNYLAFLDETQVLFLWAGLFLLLTCLFNLRNTDEKPSTTPVYYGIGSFLLILGICAGLVLTVNPDGRFPWNQRKNYTSVAAHSIKPNLYQKLRKAPDLVLFGSSISFTTPASFFKEQWGVRAFNMSFNGGGPADVLRTVNYFIQRSPNGKIPSTMLVEMLSPSLRVSNSQQTPLTMLPYLPPDQIFPAAGATLDSIIIKKSFSNAIFTSLFIDTNRWRPFVRFAADGTGIMTKREPLTPTHYPVAIKNDLPLGKSLLTCKNQQLDTQGKDYIQKLVELARTHHVSLVFYRPPINNDLYIMSDTKPAQYQRCRNLFNAFMKTLVLENPNVFYRDLSDHPKISKMGLEIYIDTHHVNPRGGKLILLALDKEIKAALTWSRLNHK